MHSCERCGAQSFEDKCRRCTAATFSSGKQNLDIGHIIHVSAGATKHDDGKDDFTYVSTEMMTALARVRAFGSKKYSRNNWKKGFKIDRSLAAALRHIFARLAGQKLDFESGLDHLWHAACCLEHAIYDAARHPENEIEEAKS